MLWRLTTPIAVVNVNSKQYTFEIIDTQVHFNVCLYDYYTTIHVSSIPFNINLRY